MKKMILIIILGVLCLTGCDEVKNVVEKANIEASNNQEVKTKRLQTIKLEYVCDDRGYKYYTQRTYMNEIALPLFVNGVYGAYQVRCDGTLK